MTKRASIIEIRKLTQASIVKCDALIEETTGNPNPLVWETRVKAQGRKEAFEAVLAATYADYFELGTFT